MLSETARKTIQKTVTEFVDRGNWPDQPRYDENVEGLKADLSTHPTLLAEWRDHVAGLVDQVLPQQEPVTTVQFVRKDLEAPPA